MYALDDHEIGDNQWKLNSDHTNSLGQYRKGFVESLYLDPTSREYIYKNMKLGNTHLTPYGTPFEYTSFAHVHKNILFVTMDVPYSSKFLRHFFKRQMVGLVGME